MNTSLIVSHALAELLRECPFCSEVDVIGIDGPNYLGESVAFATFTLHWGQTLSREYRLAVSSPPNQMTFKIDLVYWRPGMGVWTSRRIPIDKPNFGGVIQEAIDRVNAEHDLYAVVIGTGIYDNEYEYMVRKEPCLPPV